MKKIKKATLRQAQGKSLRQAPAQRARLVPLGRQGKKITKEMGISEILQRYPKTFEVFLNYNLPCVGCAAAHFENLEAIAKEFNIDIEKFLEDLNRAAK
jgi:hybrid cluster-associated redox disulfide protein